MKLDEDKCKAAVDLFADVYSFLERPLVTVHYQKTYAVVRLDLRLPDKRELGR